MFNNNTRPGVLPVEGAFVHHERPVEGFARWQIAGRAQVPQVSLELHPPESARQCASIGARLIIELFVMHVPWYGGRDGFDQTTLVDDHLGLEGLALFLAGKAGPGPVRGLLLSGVNNQSPDLLGRDDHLALG